MGYVLVIVVMFLLTGGFIVLTQFETQRGIRVWGEHRMKLDVWVEHIVSILTHVELGAFLRAEARRILVRIGHDIAHLSLQFVRFAERMLTRLVRHFRVRHEMTSVPRENARDFVKTLSEFKNKLKATHPEISDIQ